MVWYYPEASMLIIMIFVFLKHPLIIVIFMINVIFIMIFDYYGLYDDYDLCLFKTPVI